MITRAQLRELGFSDKGIEQRLARGRLHPVHRGVYAVGRPELTQLGRWMAAVLACGQGALLSHASGAALWGIRDGGADPIEVSVPGDTPRRVPGLLVHRRSSLAARDAGVRYGIPVTDPVTMLIDIAAGLPRSELERAVNEADRLGLVDPESLRRALDETAPRPGVGRLRRLLDRATFTLTRSELERRFLRIASAAGLPKPQTCVEVNGFEVDFYWRDLRLVVETDGLRYHRTPAQQARDRLRDQAHTAAGLTHLRFTHAQVGYSAEYVRGVLQATAARAA